MTDGERDIRVEMPREKWDVVLHVLGEELAQLVPPEGDWIGKYPGEESVEAVEEACQEIARSVDTERDQDGETDGDE